MPCLLPVFPLTLLMASCSAGPLMDEGPRSVTYALAEPEQTSLGRAVFEASQRHGGKSGAALLVEGQKAFGIRLALARAAEETLDIQYFIWEPDAAGLAMLTALVEAAHRGVRVRLLLDDLYLEPNDENLALLDSHPNAEVRLFNASRDRKNRRTGFLTSFRTFNHRMHNKAFIADNAWGIVGGRNISNKYFLADDRSNFRDIDLLSAGPVVKQISASFDEFWNNPLAMRMELLQPSRPMRENGVVLIDRMQKRMRDSADGLDGLLENGSHDVPAPDDLLWVHAAAVADGPFKPVTARPLLAQELAAYLQTRPTSQVLFEIAYVIPGKAGVDYICALVEDGVRVRGLTNSFASNDLLVTHAGYTTYRQDLVECGVELYELRPDPVFMEKGSSWRPESEALLHSKAVVIDDQWSFVGSPNLDPRSILLNSELGVVIADRKFANRLTEEIEAAMTLDNAYRVTMKDGRLAWVTRRDGRLTITDTEPDTGLWDRFTLAVMRALPIEGML